MAKSSSMPATPEGRKSKRKRSSGNAKKFLVDEKVEVRSLEDGFLGSWHQGTIVACKSGSRLFKYDYIRDHNTSEALVDTVPVNGCFSKDRPVIRPVPPAPSCEKSMLYYGLCVDASYEDAWWEGVIFDREEGSEERAVFFPDLGDKLVIPINHLRITLDWNEAKDTWGLRGNWSVLELIDEYKQQRPPCVSVEQIWYDMRAKQEFELVGEWTSPSEAALRFLVLDAVSDAFNLAVDNFFRLLDHSEDLSLVPKSEQVMLDVPATDDNQKHDEEGLAGFNAVCEFESDRSVSGDRYNRRGERCRPGLAGMVPGAECFPGAITEYVNSPKGSVPSSSNISMQLVEVHKQNRGIKRSRTENDLLQPESPLPLVELDSIERASSTGKRNLRDAKKLRQKKYPRSSLVGSRSRKRRTRQHNDFICSVCGEGGVLLLCDECPSSFHMDCLGLKDVPTDKWFCPSCVCGVCCKGGSNGGVPDAANDCFLKCCQCERQYHLGCLREKELATIESFPTETWFCCEICENIFMALQNLLGKVFSLGSGLTWTLLKSKNYDGSNFDGSHVDASKLKAAVSVMHECFKPLREPHSTRDLVKDVIFSRGSELNRSNFQGFYTVLLERDAELACVATLRVYGQEVAEVPLVGTRFQYRRQGMCFALMNEIERRLAEIGVKQLVLPAAPYVLNTWTSSFGFRRMTDAEKPELLGYTFLCFPGTVMCLKSLKEASLVHAHRSCVKDANIAGKSRRGSNDQAVPVDAEQASHLNNGGPSCCESNVEHPVEDDADLMLSSLVDDDRLFFKNYDIWALKWARMSFC